MRNCRIPIGDNPIKSDAGKQALPKCRNIWATGVPLARDPKSWYSKSMRCSRLHWAHVQDDTNRKQGVKNHNFKRRIELRSVIEHAPVLKNRMHKNEKALFEIRTLEGAFNGVARRITTHQSTQSTLLLHFHSHPPSPLNARLNVLIWRMAGPNWWTHTPTHIYTHTHSHTFRHMHTHKHTYICS